MIHRKYSRHNKQSLYFATEEIDEMIKEASRLDRSMSWVVRAAWAIAKQRIKEIPSARTHVDEIVQGKFDHLPQQSSNCELKPEKKDGENNN